MTLDCVSVEGHRTARMAGETTAASVDLDRGAHVFDLRPAGSALNLLYEDPRGLAAHEVGGWYELFPNAGPACDGLGGPLTAHGDVRDLPWQLIAAERARASSFVEARVASRCMPLEVSRRLVLCNDTATVLIEETVTNLGPDRCAYLWGHHITFGQAFVADARIDVPTGRVFARQQYQSAATRLAVDASGPLDGLPSRDSDVLDLSRFPHHRRPRCCSSTSSSKTGAR